MLQRLVDRPKAFEDLAARPQFRILLDQGQHELSQVLTDYSFRSLIPCGLSQCRTPHRAGYLVQTVDGLETNVGHVCGRKNFGESFEILRGSYARARDRDDLLQQAARVKSTVATLQLRLQEISRGRFGARWANKFRSELTSLLGDQAFDRLLYGVEHGDLRVTEARERTEAEIANLIARAPQSRERARIETIEVGSLAPMPWLTFDFRGRIRDEAMLPLEAFSALDVDALKTPKLRATVKSMEGVSQTLDEAEAALASAPSFFNSDNLELLVRWLPDWAAQRRRLLADWIKSKTRDQWATGQAPS